MDVNSKVALLTHKGNLSEIQIAACQIIPQGINLALTIRELVRQGYLFGALVLVRSLIERVAVISYLQRNPDEIRIWKDGWKYKERPSLEKMLNTMSDSKFSNEIREDIAELNHITHGDPVGSKWNLIPLSDGTMGYSSGKVINDPDLCDYICVKSYLFLIVLMGLMATTFPEKCEID